MNTSSRIITPDTRPRRASSIKARLDVAALLWDMGDPDYMSLLSRPQSRLPVLESSSSESSKSNRIFGNKRKKEEDETQGNSWEQVRALVSEYVICAEELEDILSSAVKEDKGGLGGGLALFTCDQPSCGALYCIGCAVEHVQRSLRRDPLRSPKCCVCTRPWNLKSLQDQAKDFDPTAYGDLDLVSDDEDHYRRSRPAVRPRIEREQDQVGIEQRAEAAQAGPPSRAGRGSGRRRRGGT
ncbi:hypothetical protein I317_04414 [Kwoniella heveanensis CBS 569]|nr:hypothetical protein I317_04414 [Kwoniella heveanensis CBS 569]